MIEMIHLPKCLRDKEEPEDARNDKHASSAPATRLANKSSIRQHEGKEEDEEPDSDADEVSIAHHHVKKVSEREKREENGKKCDDHEGLSSPHGTITCLVGSGVQHLTRTRSVTPAPTAALPAEKR
jgi:hypothetical protein